MGKPAIQHASGGDDRQARLGADATSPRPRARKKAGKTAPPAARERPAGEPERDIEHELDDALAMTFPASDPLAVDPQES